MLRFSLLFLPLLLIACDPRPDSQISGSELLEMLSADNGPKISGIEQTLLNSAQEAEKNKEYGRALQFYRQLVDKNADNLAYKVGIADNMRRLAKTDEALRQYDAILEKQPDNIEALEGKGLALLSKTDFQQASIVLERVMALDSRRWRTLNAVAILFVAKNMPKESLAYYEEALSLMPDEPVILNNVGLTMALNRDFDRALLALTRASQKLKEKDPQKRRVDLNLALVYGISGQMEKAEQVAKPHLSEAALNNNLGFYAYLANNEDLAKGYLNHAISGSPTFYEKAWKNLEVLGESGSQKKFGNQSYTEKPLHIPAAPAQAEPKPAVKQTTKAKPVLLAPPARKPEPVAQSQPEEPATPSLRKPAPEPAAGIAVPVPSAGKAPHTLSDNAIVLPDMDDSVPVETMEEMEEMDIAPAVIAPMVDVTSENTEEPAILIAPQPADTFLREQAPAPAEPAPSADPQEDTDENLSNGDKGFLDSFGEVLWE